MVRRLGRIHRQDIDGLRAVAVLAVVAFHCSARGFAGGFVGVDVFFVISGYLICGILWKQLESERFSLARFYQRRCKRILPALFVVLLFTLAAGYVLLSPYELRQLGEGTAATALSVSNLDFYRHGNYFFRPTLNPLLMTWSLAVEEQFYVVFPLLLWGLFRFARRGAFAVLAGICCCSLLLSVMLEFRHPEMNFYMPFTRAWELGAGALLALWESSRTGASRERGWMQEVYGGVGLAMIVACIVFYSASTRFPGYEAIPPVLGAVMLLSAEGSAVNRLLGVRPVVAVGLVSYSLYLWHWPVLSFAAIVAPGELSAGVKCVLMLLAAALAVLSYFLVEQPFRFARSGSALRTVTVSLAGIAVMACVGLAVFRSGGLPGRSPVLAGTERSLELTRDRTCLLGSDTLKRVPACLPEDTAQPKVALLGDSHAEALEAEVRQRAADAGYGLLSMELYSCPPLQDVTRVLRTDPTHAAMCASFNQRMLKVVESRPDVKDVVLAGSWAMVEEDYFAPDAFAGDVTKMAQRTREQYLEEGLRDEIHALEAAGKQVVLVDDVPSLQGSPLDEYRARLLPWRGKLRAMLSRPDAAPGAWGSVPRGGVLNASSERVRQGLLAMATTDPRVKVVDTKPAFCDGSVCRFSDGKQLFYIDNNHVSRTGARMALGSLSFAPATGS